MSGHYVSQVGRRGLIDAPCARRGQLQQVAVRIPEIDRAAAALPGAALDDFNLVFGQPLFPAVKLRRLHRKAEVLLPRGVVGGGPEGERGPALAHQQHLAAFHTQGPEPLVAGYFLEAEDFFVEAGRALDVVHVERRLQHPGELGPHRPIIPPRPGARDPRPGALQICVYLCSWFGSAPHRSVVPSHFFRAARTRGMPARSLVTSTSAQASPSSAWTRPAIW